MLGLLGAYGLHMRLQSLADRKQSGTTLSADEASEYESSMGLMKRVITNLDKLLPRSADVGALGIHYGVELRNIDYSTPPMLYHSWSLIAPGASKSMIPADSYASRIAPGLTSMRPWLIWKTAQMLKPAGKLRIPVKVRDVMLLQRSRKRAPAPDQITEAIVSTPISGFTSIQALAKSIGIPTSTLEASIARVRDVDPA
jgi:hypothetical protein